MGLVLLQDSLMYLNLIIHPNSFFFKIHCQWQRPSADMVVDSKYAAIQQRTFGQILTQSLSDIEYVI